MDSNTCEEEAETKPSILTSSDTQSTNQNNVDSEIESNVLTDLKNLSVQDAVSDSLKNQERNLSKPKPDNPDLKLSPLIRATKLFQNKDLSKVVVLVGAGLSTNSGIMDFRTPGTGLYDNLKQYNIPYPEAIFDIDYFNFNPKPFFTLAKELYPSVKYRPNYNHYFLRLLYEKGLLLRLYTQNIDGLERLSGIPCSKLIECHGTFAHATCLACRKKYKGNEVKNAIFNEDIPKCKQCEAQDQQFMGRGKSFISTPGIIKPDIVFFGEDLPKTFYHYRKDMSRAELILIMGTSLEVHPFAGIIDCVPSAIPRILFNMEAVGPFKQTSRPNDFTVKGDLTESLEKLVTQLNWQTEILKLLEEAESEKYANKFHKDLKKLGTSSPLKELNPELKNNVNKSSDSVNKSENIKNQSVKGSPNITKNQ